MPSTQTRKDWAYGLFALSRDVNPDNQALFSNELNVLLTRYISSPPIITQVTDHIDYGLATSVFEKKGDVFGLKTKHSKRLLSDIFAQLLLDESHGDTLHDFLALLFSTLSAFERAMREIENDKRIYSTSMLAFRLYTYPLTVDTLNQASLEQELFEAIDHVLGNAEYKIGQAFEFHNTISYGLVPDDERLQTIGFYPKGQLHSFYHAFPGLPLPQNIPLDEWEAILAFIPYFLMTFSTWSLRHE